MEKRFYLYKAICPTDSDELFSEAVLSIDKQLEDDPNNADIWMERGLALVRQKKMNESIEAFSMAISIDPFKALYYRYRGHRHISCWNLNQAIADFVVGSRLDPTNWDIWYHLGLAYFLKGDYKKAEYAYHQCFELTIDDVKCVAVVNWYWASLMRLGKKEKAKKLIDENINQNMNPGYNLSYYELISMYKGSVSPQDILSSDAVDDIEKITKGYGVANYFYINGDTEKANEIIENIISYKSMEIHYTFAYIAALAEKTNHLSEKQN